MKTKTPDSDDMLKFLERKKATIGYYSNGIVSEWIITTSTHNTGARTLKGSIVKSIAEHKADDCF